MINVKEMTYAILYGTNMKFKVDYYFADKCFDWVGKVVKHPLLGNLFCHECEMDENGNIKRILLVGTTTRETCRKIISV